MRNKKAFAQSLSIPHHFQESTAAPNVKILATDFEIPQLKRKRRIWIYLPLGLRQKPKALSGFIHAGRAKFV